MTAPAKRGRGRPRLPPEALRVHRLHIVLTEVEYADLEAAAVRAEADLSVWVRERALRAARRS